MAERGILVGDLVSLRTGGPTMSVRARSQNLAYCAWHKDDRIHYGTFEVGSLQLVDDKPAAGSRVADDGLPCG